MDIQTAYTQTVEAMRALGEALLQAQAVRHEPAPGGAARAPRDGKRALVGDPTVDVVLDPRNVEVNRAIYAARDTLVRVQHDLTLRVDDLRQAVDAWEGVRPSSDLTPTS